MPPLSEVIARDPATNEPVRVRIARHGITIYRQRFKSRGGALTYSRPWYFEKMVAGDIERFPLGLQQRAAEKLAEEIACFLGVTSNTLELARVKYNPRALERNTGYATIGDCVETFEKALNIIGRKGHAVSKKTFAGYKAFLVAGLRRVEAHRAGKPWVSFSGQRNVDSSKWLNLPSGYLTAKFVMDFKLASVPRDDEADEEEILTAKITADSSLRNMRSLFSFQALRYYRTVGLNLPDLSGFLTEPDYSAKKYFQLLPPDVIVNVWRSSLELRMADLDAYRAFALCIMVGLRAADALAFEPSWIRHLDRPTILVTAKGTYNPKHGHGRKVVVAPWVAELLAEIGPIQSTVAIDRLNDWLRLQGVDVNKPTHELRKLWFSAKTKTEGLLAAQQQGGHKDPKVTSQYYADNMMPEYLLPFWQAPTAKVIELPQFKSRAV